MADRQPDSRSFCAAIAACSAERWRKALALLDTLRSRSAECDVVVMGVAVAACDWARGLEAQRQLQQLKVEPNVVACSALATACDAWTSALHTFARMKLIHVQPNVVTNTAIITACEGFDWGLAVQLLREFCPSTASQNSALDSLAGGSAECWQMALVLLQGMDQAALEANGITFSTGLAVCQAELWPVGASLLEDTMQPAGWAMAAAWLVLWILAEGSDQSEFCGSWAAAGECTRNAAYMLKACPESCGAQNGCKEWAAAGECEKNPNFMLKVCAAACDSPKAAQAEPSTATSEGGLSDPTERAEKAEALLQQARKDLEEMRRYLSEANKLALEELERQNQQKLRQIELARAVAEEKERQLRQALESTKSRAALLE
ncbi:unnamed protein product, partial [Effrenium voratum]